MTVGDNSWTVDRTYEEVRDFSEFIRNQMSSTSSQFNYKKLLKTKNWKSYVEFQRNVHNAEIVFNIIQQNSEELNYNSIMCILYFLEVKSIFTILRHHLMPFIA